MSSESQHIEYLNLITKKLSGEINADEEQKLQLWLDSSADNREVYASYERTWKEMDRVQDKTSREIDQEWSRLEGVLDFSEEAQDSKERSLFSSSYRIAAAIALFLIAGFVAYYFINTGGNEQLVALVETQAIELSEGSVVTVNSNSKLTYPKEFKEDRRQVELSGEAFFEIAEDPKRPFIIDAGEVWVEVLGTSFNVKAYEHLSEIEVTVSSGRVAIYPKERPNERVVLVKGQKAVFYRSNTKIEAALNDDINFASWKTKQIIFEDTPMPEVVRIINEIYKSDIRLIGDQLVDCPVTTTFDNQSLESILNVLESTLELTIEQDGQEVEISGEGC